MKQFLLLVISFCLLNSELTAQSRVLSGRVTNEQGAGMANVSVTIKGGTAGTTTDANGAFSLSVPGNAATLVVSSVGYRTQEVEINGQNNLLIQLTGTQTNLDEVVVTGYTSIRRSKSPVASAVVGSGEIQDVPMANVNDILQGKATGLTITSTTGQPGGSSNVRVRGVGSISAGANPLYVIDGIIVERGQFVNGFGGFTQNNDILSNLNPNDIDNVTVLKDAAALALYGARGGNGVIVINTKRGKSGAPRINFSAQRGQSQPSLGNWGMMDAKQVYDYERNILKSSGVSQASIDQEYPVSLLDKTFDWVNAAFVKGKFQSYDLSISGGNDKARQFFSMGYYDQQGTVLNSGFKRITANLGIDYQLSSRLKFGTTFNTSFSNTLNGDGGGFFSSPILATITNSPLWLYPYKEDGSLYVGNEDAFSKNSSNNVTGDNFLYSSSLNYNRAKQFRGFGKVYGEFKITDWLSLKQNAAIDLIYAREKNFFDPTTGNGINAADPSQSGTIFEGLNTPLTFTSQTSMGGNFGLKDGRHEFEYLLLTEYQRFNASNFYAQGNGIVDGRLQVLNVTSTPQAATGGENEYAFLSYLGQVNYTLNDRYSLNGTLRRDGSSRFGANNRFATFYAVGGSWRLIKEAFMENQHLFNDLRLRASYGTSGVADFGDYLALSTYAYGQTYDGAPGSAPNTPGNPDLTWEKNKQLDIGLEFSMWNNRLRATLDVYRRVSENLLQNVPISRTAGYIGTGIQRNIGELENKGIELSLNTINVRNARFTWSTDLNLSQNRNKVLKLYNGQDIPNGTLGRTREGRSLNSWFLPVWAGVDPSNGDPLWYLADGKTTNSYAIASRTENRQFVGSALPKYTIGLTNNFQYGGLSLSFFLYAVQGAKVYNQNLSFMDSDGLRFGWNYYKDADKNFWTTPGQAADRPKPLVGGNKNSASASSRWVESNDYIRLRNVTLSYQLPKAWIGRAHLTGARLYLTGTNLLTFTNYRGVDPETLITGNDVFKYPVSKNLTVGIDLNF